MFSAYQHSTRLYIRQKYYLKIQKKLLLVKLNKDLPIFIFIIVFWMFLSSFLPEEFWPLIKTLPLRLSFPLESMTDRPRLKMDFHFLDFPENFLLCCKKVYECLRM